jgi:tRNA(Leu) C34 or U34 (ribose-2'-O)-methylase TrmL
MPKPRIHADYITVLPFRSCGRFIGSIASAYVRFVVGEHIVPKFDRPRGFFLIHHFYRKVGVDHHPISDLRFHHCDVGLLHDAAEIHVRSIAIYRNDLAREGQTHDRTYAVIIFIIASAGCPPHSCSAFAAAALSQPVWDITSSMSSADAASAAPPPEGLDSGSPDI